MSLTTAAGNNLLKLLMNATTWNDLAQDDATTPNTVYYVSLHTSSPGVAGVQNTNEASYTGYARISVARTSGGWTCGSGLTTDNTAQIGGDGTSWKCTGGSATITHVGLGKSSSGATDLYLFGALTASLAVSTGIDPTFAIGALDIVAS